MLNRIYKNLDHIDFIEIALKRDFARKKLNIIKNIKIPYSIHLPTSNDGVDLGNLNQREQNIKFLDSLEKYDKNLSELNPICYIIHPESGNKEYSLKNLSRIKLSPLAIENMPFIGIHGEKMIGYNLEDLCYYFKKIPKLQLCFDLNHAIKAALSLKERIFPFLKSFLKLKEPIIFHIADGYFKEEFDNHLAIDYGDYDMQKIKKILNNLPYKVNLTFETPRTIENNITEDINNILTFKKI